MRIAINGMGRIGRLLFKLLQKSPHCELIAVNDPMPADNLLYLLRHDSILAPYDGSLTMEGSKIVANGPPVSVFDLSNPEDLPWKKLDIDVVVECSGKFITSELASKHLTAGARQVLLSTTGTPEIPLLVYGWNEELLSRNIPIISPGGCMTNCSTTAIQVMASNFDVSSLHINILHSYTSRQALVDGSHHNYRRGRASAVSIIPVEIDLAKTLGRLFERLDGRIDATSTRVPVLAGALAYFYFVIDKEVAVADINRIYREAARTDLEGILGYNEDPIVSADILGNRNSAIYDATLTSVNHSHVRIGCWFDNEFGYTNRLSEILGMLNDGAVA